MTASRMWWVELTHHAELFCSDLITSPVSGLTFDMTTGHALKLDRLLSFFKLKVRLY